MVDKCSSCFFGRMATKPGTEDVVLTCRIAGPRAVSVVSVDVPVWWPEVDPDDWCGEGADDDTMLSFSAGVVGMPAGPVGPEGPPGASWTVGTDAPTGDAPAGSFYIQRDEAIPLLIVAIWQYVDEWNVIITSFAPTPEPGVSITYDDAPPPGAGAEGDIFLQRSGAEPGTLLYIWRYQSDEWVQIVISFA